MKYGGLNENTKLLETWESLLWTADNDFISVLILWYSGTLIGSTYAWMLPHTLEKYLKSYMVNSGKRTIKEFAKKYKESGHDLNEIWTDYKSITNATTSKEKLNIAFDQIINDLATIKTKLRYSGFIEYSSDSLIYFYIVLCSYLRYLIIGNTKYRSTLYGLDDMHFLPMNYAPMSQGYSKLIVRKMLHLSLEHGFTFTNMGFVNSMTFDEYSISNTAIFEKINDCPVCNHSKKLDQVNLIKFYRDICPAWIEMKDKDK